MTPLNELELLLQLRLFKKKFGRMYLQKFHLWFGVIPLIDIYGIDLLVENYGRVGNWSGRQGQYRRQKMKSYLKKVKEIDDKINTKIMGQL